MWGAHVRIRARFDGEEPLALRVKISSATTFGRSEVDYYLHTFVGLPDAPLVTCHDAAADDTHYHLLLDDLGDTHRNQHDVQPTLGYGHALAEASAKLNAFRWPQPPPDPAELERTFGEARVGLPIMLDAMAEDFASSERDTVAALFDWHPRALRERLGDPNGFTFVHGDLNPGNILGPKDDDGPVYLIDHQPFGGSAMSWLGVGDLAHAMVVWWPVEARRALARGVVAHWHQQLLARGVRHYPLEQAWDDFRLCALAGVYVPAGRCAEPGGVDGMRWLWQAQLRRVLAAVADE